MRLRHALNPAREEGFVLIEIMVSALVLIAASAGVMVLLQTTTHSQADLRNSSEAYALAQEDQARLASMRLSTLNRLDETRTVTLNNTKFSVRSRGVFVNDTTSRPSCGEGTSSADYVEITSSVSWPGMNPGERSKIVSILSPSNGSLDPNRGTIAFSVVTQNQTPVSNVYISGGSGAFAGYTDAYGCAVFADLPAGNYTASVNGEGAGVVNKDGKYTQTESVPVAAGDTKTVTFEFDRPGTINVGFSYRIGTGSTFAASSSDALVLYHPNMEGGTARVLGTPGGSRVATISAAPLFPFSSTYTVYGGSCTSNDPGTGAGKVSVAAPRGGSASVTVQLPAFDPVVWSGTSSSSKGSPLAKADVWIRDTTCKAGSNLVTRRYTTNSEGRLPDLGLPYGTYTVCADTEPGTGTTGVRRQKLASSVSVKSLTAPTTANLYLGSGGSGVESGSCS